MKKLLLLDGIVWFTVYLFVSMLSLYFSSDSTFGGGKLAGVSVGLFFLFRALVDIVSPKLERQFHQKKLTNQITAALILLLISYLFLLFSDNITKSLISVIIMGTALGIYSPAKYALFSSLIYKKDESRWGLLDSIGLFTVSLAGFTSGWLVNSGGFSLLFGIGSLLSLLAVIVSLSLHKVQ